MAASFAGAFGLRPPDLDVVWHGFHQWEAGRNLSLEAADVYVVWLVDSGRLGVSLDGVPHAIEAGEAFFQPAGVAREIRALEPSVWRSVGFRWRASPAALPSLTVGSSPARHLNQEFGLPRRWTPQPAVAASMGLAFDEIRSQHGGGSPAANLRVSGAMTWLLGLCWSEIGAVSSGGTLLAGSAPLWLTRALLLLEREPHRGIGDIADEVGYSPAQFRARFRQLVGCSPRDFATGSLDTRARQMLSTTDWSVERIASELGFSAPTHFARFFKKQTGLSPQRYRQYGAGI